MRHHNIALLIAPIGLVGLILFASYVVADAGPGVYTSPFLRYTCDDSDVSGSDVFDRGSSTNNGTLTGAVGGGVGVCQQACSFDGTNDYITTNDNLGVSGETDRTVMMWVNATSWASLLSLFGWGASATRETFLFTELDGGELRLEVNAEDKTTATLSIAAGIYTHAAIKLNESGTRYTFYVNGVQAESGTFTSALNTADSQAYIGTRFYDFAQDYSGLMDEIRVYGVALSNTDILYAYSSPCIATASNFTITATRSADSATILNFTANITGAGYTDTFWQSDTTTGTLTVTGILQNDTAPYNITVASEGYYSFAYTDYNISLSGHLQATLNDSVFPNIAANPLLANNQTVVYNGTLDTYINFTDNIEIYSINVSWWNGSVYYNQSNMGINFTQINITAGVGSTVSQYLDAKVCDAHTAQEINEVPFISKTKGLSYAMKKNFLFFESDYLRVYPESSAGYDGADTKKEKDRYTFTMNKKSEFSAAETFIVESDHFIDIAAGQRYGGHLVIPSLGETGRWVDFEAAMVGLTYSISRISDKKVAVTVYGLQGKSVKFLSTGELNCLTQRFYFGNLNPVAAFTPEILTQATDNITLNVTIDAITVHNITAFLTYNNTVFQSNSSPAFFKVVTTPEITGIAENVSLHWNITVNGYSYQLPTYLQEVYDFDLGNCSTYSFPAINGSFFEENSRQPSLMNITGTFEFSASTGLTRNQTLELTNITQFSICKNLNETLTVDAYFQYRGAAGLLERYYLLDETLSNETILLNLYNFESDDGLSNLEAVIQNFYFEKQQGTLMKMQRFYPELNAWITVQVDLSDEGGAGLFYVYQREVDYKLLFLVDGVVEEETTTLRFACDSVASCDQTFTLSPSSAEDALSGMAGRWDYNDGTQMLSFTWNDATSAASSVHVVVEKQGSDAPITICDTTVASSSGSIMCNTTGYTGILTANAFRTASPENIWSSAIIEKLSRALSEVIGETGGIFFSFLIALAIAGMTAISPILGIVGMVMGFAVMMYLGISALITLSACIGMFSLGLIVLYFLKRG